MENQVQQMILGTLIVSEFVPKKKKKDYAKMKETPIILKRNSEIQYTTLRLDFFKIRSMNIQGHDRSYGFRHN